MYVRDDGNKAIKSFGEQVGTATKSVTTKSYTGNEMVGIATMHKSNAVPVFNSEAAKDLATMRRS